MARKKWIKEGLLNPASLKIGGKNDPAPKKSPPVSKKPVLKISKPSPKK